MPSGRLYKILYQKLSCHQNQLVNRNELRKLTAIYLKLMSLRSILQNNSLIER
jgi:hypothetical protein